MTSLSAPFAEAHRVLRVRQSQTAHQHAGPIEFDRACPSRGVSEVLGFRSTRARRPRRVESLTWLLLVRRFGEGITGTELRGVRAGAGGMEAGMAGALSGEAAIAAAVPRGARARRPARSASPGAFTRGRVRAKAAASRLPARGSSFGDANAPDGARGAPDGATPAPTNLTSHVRRAPPRASRVVPRAADGDNSYGSGSDYETGQTEVMRSVAERVKAARELAKRLASREEELAARNGTLPPTQTAPAPPRLRLPRIRQAPRPEPRRSRRRRDRRRRRRRRKRTRCSRPKARTMNRSRRRRTRSRRTTRRRPPRLPRAI